MTLVIRRYVARLRHDRGTVKIATWAQSEAAARAMICAAEGCPDRAIISIREAR